MDERCETKEERYASENLMRYHTAVAVAEKLEQEGLLSACDKQKIIDVVSWKHGLGRHSIFTI